MNRFCPSFWSLSRWSSRAAPRCPRQRTASRPPPSLTRRGRGSAARSRPASLRIPARPASMAARPARCIRRARPARRRRRKVARRAVLHLAWRPGRLPAVRGALAGGRAGRARAPAARRPQHEGARSHHRRARRASEHRGAPLQPARQSRRPRAQLPDRLHAREPAHAQQVVHRRQPGDDRRRTQHRQRVLRRRQPASRSPTWTCSPWDRRCARCRRSSISTGTARRPTRRRVSSVRQCRTAPPISRPNSRRTAPTPNRSPISRRCARRRWCASCSTGSSRSSGTTPRSCTTTRPRRSTPRSGPTCCSSRSSCARWAGRRRRSTSSRRTSCPATAAPSSWRRWPNAA